MQTAETVATTVGYWGPEVNMSVKRSGVKGPARARWPAIWAAKPCGCLGHTRYTICYSSIYEDYNQDVVTANMPKLDSQFAGLPTGQQSPGGCPGYVECNTD